MNLNGSQMAKEDRLRANTIATYAVGIIRGEMDPDGSYGWVNWKGKREDVTREVLEAVDRFAIRKDSV